MFGGEFPFLIPVPVGSVWLFPFAVSTGMQTFEPNQSGTGPVNGTRHRNREQLEPELFLSKASP
jgi:hypothetical protein